MRSIFAFLLLTAALLVGSLPLQAGILVTALPVAATAGDTGDYFDITLTNTGSDFLLGAFSLGFSVVDPHVTFTSVGMNTAAPYAVAGDSFVVLSMLASNIDTTSGGQTVVASDLSNSGAGVLVASGATVGLGRVYFNVGPGAVTHTEAVVFNLSATSLADQLAAPVAIDTLTDGSIQITGVAVPEPAMMLPLGLAMLVGVGLYGRRAERVRSTR